ncbi:hypothetical protein CRM22_009767 [Opisthorchis felineus]|uniref:Uncharacterized protein n=1 Tax=Opisthorchis felineus TaxID=147828 RepID=A0A4S2LCL7_OPIFE|nr:hypothetical protein CRM22_009767 [Opisthorchis felineus]
MRLGVMQGGLAWLPFSKTGEMMSLPSHCLPPAYMFVYEVVDKQIHRSIELEEELRWLYRTVIFCLNWCYRRKTTRSNKRDLSQKFKSTFCHDYLSMMHTASIEYTQFS